MGDCEGGGGMAGEERGVVYLGRPLNRLSLFLVLSVVTFTRLREPGVASSLALERVEEEG